MGACLAGLTGGAAAPKMAPFPMKLAVAPPGGFASSYEKVPDKNFAFLIPGDEELFVGGGALNGAVGKLLFADANQPIQFEWANKAAKKYAEVEENGKQVPKFTKATCPYKKTQTALYKKGLAKKNTLVVADAAEIGTLPVLWSGGRVYSDCDHPFGSVFLHIFKKENCPFGQEKNAALLYCVGALGINAKAPGEGVPDPAREKYIKHNVQDFLWELNKSGESTVQIVFDYNKDAAKKKLPVIEVIRLPVVSGGVFLHPDITAKEAALALIWGVHTALARNSAGGKTLAVELMPGKPMEEAYEAYKSKKVPGDYNPYNKITLAM